MQKSKRWIVKNTNNEGFSFSNDLNLSPVILSTIRNRGIKSEEDLNKFIYPELEDLYDPFQLPDMEKAVEVIKESIDSNEKIMIYGDYDADGVTSTSLLYKFMRSLGADVEYYIPSRFDEGYGLNIDAVQDIIKKGTKLIITVDCGVSAIEEVKYCIDAGIKIIVTDHHECGPVLPDTMVINPKRSDSNYPFNELAGVGVAFKLIQAISTVYDDIDVYEYLELASIGTVADIVPLLDENRVIVKYGLESIQNTENIGIKALVDTVNLQLDTINSGHIGYIIAPRINAAGRMGSADIGVELFTTYDEEKAYNLAEKLCSANKDRQETEEKIFNQAQEMLEGMDDYVVVLENENWHIGVIGIVASKLVDKYGRPVVLLSRDGESCRGSARSIPGFNIYEGFCRCSDLLTKFGGHEQAAGLSIDHEKVEEFRIRLNTAASQMVSKIDSALVLNADCRIKTDSISLKLADEITMLEPFGMGNPSPVFVYSSVLIDDIRTVGAQDKHLKIRLRDGDNTIDAIAFNMGYNIDGYERNDVVDIVCSVSKNSWNNRDSVQLIVRDIRKSIYKGIEETYCSSIKNHIERLHKCGEIEEYELNNLNILPLDIHDVMAIAAENKYCLVVMSTIDALNQVLEYSDVVNICFENNSSDDRYGTIVVCPDAAGLDLNCVEEIYVLDNLIDYKTLLDNAAEKGIKCFACTCDTEEDQSFIKSIMPLRQDMESLYLYLKKSAKNGSLEFNIDRLAKSLSMDKIKLNYSLAALGELGIINFKINEEGTLLVKFNPYSKNPMENSRTVNMFGSIMKSLNSLNIILRNMRGKS